MRTGIWLGVPKEYEEEMDHLIRCEDLDWKKEGTTDHFISYTSVNNDVLDIDEFAQAGIPFMGQRYPDGIYGACLYLFMGDGIVYAPDCVLSNGVFTVVVVMDDNGVLSKDSMEHADKFLALRPVFMEQFASVTKENKCPFVIRGNKYERGGLIRVHLPGETLRAKVEDYLVVSLDNHPVNEDYMYMDVVKIDTDFNVVELIERRTISYIVYYRTEEDFEEIKRIVDTNGLMATHQVTGIIAASTLNDTSEEQVMEMFKNCPPTIKVLKHG